MNHHHLRIFCVLIIFSFGGYLFGQNRLIRPLSHIEDRLIALDPTLIESFRFNNQNLDLMSKIDKVYSYRLVLN